MNKLMQCLATGALGAAVLGATLSGCVVDGGPGYAYGGDVDVGVGVDYYQPVGVFGGGWGPGYRVGPPRGDDGHRRPEDPHRGGPGDAPHGAPGGGGTHAFRPAPASHPAPSIPSHGRR